LQIAAGDRQYTLSLLAEKSGFQVFACTLASDDQLPDANTRLKIERQLTPLVAEHLLVFLTPTTQFWQWARREPNALIKLFKEMYAKSSSGERLGQKLALLAFYRSFLLRLFHEGLGAQTHTPQLIKLIGRVPYLNGGLFEVHKLEEGKAGENIEIPDKAFKRIFDFFDEYDWHLDSRPLASGREINPDVLGYIEQFRPREAKPIIDEIDRVLARHYGFTDEELDFIINYDIKYRMGRDGEE
jgi:hypothetical protein